MKKIICWFKGHKRGRDTCVYNRLSAGFLWVITCQRCGYKAEYYSPRLRLVGKEIGLGFDGE